MILIPRIPEEFLRVTTNFDAPMCSDFSHLGYECVDQRFCINGEAEGKLPNNNFLKETFLQILLDLAIFLVGSVQKLVPVFVAEDEWRQLTEVQSLNFGRRVKRSVRNGNESKFKPWMKICPNMRRDICCKSSRIQPSNSALR